MTAPLAVAMLVVGLALPLPAAEPTGFVLDGRPVEVVDVSAGQPMAPETTPATTPAPFVEDEGFTHDVLAVRPTVPTTIDTSVFELTRHVRTQRAVQRVTLYLLAGLALGAVLVLVVQGRRTAPSVTTR